MNESLEEDRAYLLRSLADLEREHDAGDLDDADYLALKEDYTARAAQVLRALAQAPGAAAHGIGPATPAGTVAGSGGDVGGNGDRGAGSGVGGDVGGDNATGAGVEPDRDVGSDGGTAAGVEADRNVGSDGGTAAGVCETGAAANGVSLRTHEPGETDGPSLGGVAVATAPARRSRWRSVVVGAVLVAFAGGAGTVVARSAGERTPGEAATGSIAATGPSAGIADQLAEARELIGAGRTLDAIKLFDKIIEKDPGQPEALAYRGWLLRLAGRAAGNTELIDKGMEYIERAVAADPTYPDAHFFRAFVLYQDRHDPAAAVPELRAFLAASPPEGMVPVVEDLLSRALAESQGSAAPAPAGEAGPAPSGTTAPAVTAPPG
ncbi:MAG: tetratricopeptide repeat protein [Acidimicrobiales bacterium]